MTTQWRVTWLPALNLAMFFLATAIALAMAVWQRAPIIFLCTLVAEAAGFVACWRWRRDRLRALTLFSTGYLARWIAASLSWIAENRTGAWIARFATDGQGYFESSRQVFTLDPLVLIQKMFIAATYTGVNAPGWLIYNRLATWIGDTLGGAHPLANLQLQLFASAMVAPILYAIGQRLEMTRTGWWAAWIVALHPMLIAYSAALIRDETISMLGFLLILLAIDTVRMHRGSARRWILVGLVVFMLLTLRIPSAVYFALAAGALVFAIGRPSTGRLKRLLTVSLVVALGIAIALGAQLSDVVSGNRWTEQTELRREAASPSSSIGLSALGGGRLTYIPIGVLLHFIAPFPFFRSAYDPEAGFLHHWAGAGALVNQFLLGFFIVGAVIALTRRNRVMLAAAGVALGFAVLSTLTFGDPARYMSAHAAPLVILIAVYGFRRLEGLKAIAALSWTAMLLAVHVGYFVIKAGLNG